MKKFFKWFFITIAILVVLVLVAAIILSFVLPLEKIKDFAAAKMAETLKREVRIGKISFNVFTGIGIDDLYIGNRAGFSKEPFVKADKIELRYDLWSLFARKFKVNKVALVSPSILLEKKEKSSTSAISFLRLNPKLSQKKPNRKRRRPSPQ